MLIIVVMSLMVGAGNDDCRNYSRRNFAVMYGNDNVRGDDA